MSTPPTAPSWTASDGATHPTVEQALVLIDRQLPADEAGRLRSLAQEFFRRAAWRYLEHHSPDELVGLLVAAQRLLDDKQRDDVRVRVFTLTGKHHQWERSTSVVLATVSDRPFLYDSVYEYLTDAGCEVLATLHPILGVARGNGRAVVGPMHDAPALESCLVFEIARVPPDRGAELTVGVEAVLAQVVPATTDYRPMLERITAIADRLRTDAAALPDRADDIEEAVAFLEWLPHKNFVVLGYREYDLVPHEDEHALTVRPGTGLGILRDESASSVREPVPLSRLSPDLRRFLTEGSVLTVAKSHNTCVVHRRTRMDYIGIKRFDETGHIIGEYRVLGLFTAMALSSAAGDIPVLRAKLNTLLARTGLPPGAHDYKLLVEMFEGLPKDDLFHASIDELQTMIDAMAVADPDHAVRCVIRHEFSAGAVAVTVIMPREKFSAAARERIQDVLAQRYDATVADYKLVLGSESNARLHFYLTRDHGETPDVARNELEADITRALQSWDDQLVDELRAAYPRDKADGLARTWVGGLPENYQAVTSPGEAAGDLPVLQAALADDRTHVELRPPPGGADGPVTRLKLYKPGAPMVLSDVMPVLEALGLRVLDEDATHARTAEGAGCFMHNFGVVDAATGGALDVDALRERLPAAVLRVLAGDAQSDGLNALVTRAGMTWREVVLLRTYLRYYRQLGTPLTARYLAQVLVRNPDICRGVLTYFVAKFSPEGGVPADERLRETLPPVREAVAEGIAAIPSLDDDRVLTAILNLVDSTVRTNYFRDGGTLSHIALKIRSADVLQMPAPRPLFEIFVHSPTMEGIHLRGGMIARGGLRWSDRPEDYRTEVLGLMKTQMTKNAVIVPVGSKGGFIIRQPVTDRAALAQQLETEYQTFIRGLLDVTDTITAGTVEHPPDVVWYDGDDPYLVVAADKGTAHLSDTANAISLAYNFWLGDAFASGGSQGYDHKKEGITARGAWESAKRHFRELGRDIQTEPFTVVAIGDMGGDVFGNGMLQSRATKLVAAFNHLHVFLDPDPEPERAWAERKRLFELPRSTWQDYASELISSGGGVFARNAKRVPLSPEVQAVLGIDVDEVSGPELVRAILRAPVDMLYNGGIGTYIKHTDEQHMDVGDKANDSVRVNAPEVRARVLVEGGNLGMTQRGRIELAQHGIRLNTDAIDNSAGVDMSDHEVNLKILLAQAIPDGTLAPEDRNRVLKDMTDEVSELVLRNNYLQTLALSQDEIAAREHPADFCALLQTLCDKAGLDRATEFLPEEPALVERAAAGTSLTRPELAVMLGYVKNWLTTELADSPLPDDPHLHHYVTEYFPAGAADTYASSIMRHRLRRELVAMSVANRVVNQAGIVFVQRLGEETEAAPVDAIWAYLVGNEIFGFDRLREALYAEDAVVPAAGQYRALRELESLLEQIAHWVLHNLEPLTSLSDAVSRFRPLADATTDTMMQLHNELYGAETDAARARYLEQGHSAAVAEQFVRFPVLRGVLDVLAISEQLDVPPDDVAFVYSQCGHLLRVPWLLEQLKSLPTSDRWERVARHALYEELQEHHRSIVYRTLRHRRPNETAQGMLKRYLDDHERTINRYLGTLAAVQGPAELNFAVFSVISRQLRQI